MKETKKEILSGLTGIKTSKLVANNTAKIEFENGNIAFRLHKTNVVTIKPDGTYILDTGGWKTVITKDRINQFSPFQVYSKNGIWYVEDAIFFDGIEIKRRKVLNGLTEKQQTAKEKKIKKIKRGIAGFVKLIDKPLPVPNNGDCWYCLLKTKNSQSLGDAFGDTEHLIDHIKEGYIHGSLLVNAMREKGFDDRQINIHYQIGVVDTFRRAVRQYLTKRLLTD